MKTAFKERRCLSHRELRQYLRGNMTKTQQQAVEHHLLDCPLCAHAVEAFEEAKAAGHLEEELAEADALSKPAGQKVYRRVWINWAAAAALVVLGLFSVIQYRAATANERLFAEYFTADPPNYLSLRSAQSTNTLAGKKELQTALEFYQDGVYEASLPHFNLHLEAYPEDDQAYFLLANALLGAGKSERAANLLRQLQADATSDVSRDKMSWYLALAYLEQGKTAESLNRLRQLDGTAYEARAQQLTSALQ